MAKKRAIPQAPKPNDNRDAFDQAVKENIETITGRRGARVSPLPATGASADQIAAKINELIDLLQG